MSHLIIDAQSKDGREKLRRLYTVKRTEVELVRDRGWDPAYGLRFQLTKDEIRTQQLNYNIFHEKTFDEFLLYRQENGLFPTRESFSTIYIHPSNHDHRLLVMYLNSAPMKQVAKDNISALQTFVATGQFRNIIVISENGLLSAIAFHIQNEISNIAFTIYKDIDLAYNPTKHALAPIQVNYIHPHQVPEFEKEEGLMRKQLPLILNTDPISKWYGAQEAGVFMEMLVGTETNFAIFYRNVRDPSK